MPHPPRSRSRHPTTPPHRPPPTTHTPRDPPKLTDTHITPADARSGLAHDLIAWIQTLLLTDELARCEPKRLRYRLLHTAARLAISGRTARLRLQATWPWANDLAAAFARLRALPAPG
ncbi:MAG: transposase [Pseudonocardiales bacterium]|nr:transposase [Pseudonocardiales bacterium]